MAKLSKEQRRENRRKAKEINKYLDEAVRDIKKNLKEVQSVYKVPFMMKVMKWIGMDIWYGTKVLGWEWEEDKGMIGAPHFHRKEDQWPVYRWDY